MAQRFPMTAKNLWRRLGGAKGVTMLGGLNEEQVKLIVHAATSELAATLTKQLQEGLAASSADLNGRLEGLVSAAVEKAMERYDGRIEETARKIMTRRVHSIRVLNRSGAFNNYVLVEGERQVFSAEMRDREGGLVVGRTAPVPEWTSSAPDIVAVVDQATGLVEARSPGTADLACKVEGVVERVAVTVAQSIR
jgi:hypothetical protein